jgi:hypothetical protein
MVAMFDGGHAAVSLMGIVSRSPSSIWSPGDPDQGAATPHLVVSMAAARL